MIRAKVRNGETIDKKEQDELEREKARNKTKKRNWKKKVADKKNLNFKAM